MQMQQPFAGLSHLMRSVLNDPALPDCHLDARDTVRSAIGGQDVPIGNPFSVAYAVLEVLPAVSEGDLNTETGDISPDRGNHAIRVTGTGRTHLDILRSVRCLACHLACTWLVTPDARNSWSAGPRSEVGAGARVACCRFRELVAC